MCDIHCLNDSKLLGWCVNGFSLEEICESGMEAGFRNEGEQTKRKRERRKAAGKKGGNSIVARCVV